MHPSNLHALAALHSLRAAWPHLTDAAERARQAASESGDLGTLRSQVYGTIGRSTGHGDPIGTAIERGGAGALDPYTALEVEVRDGVAQLARMTLDDPGARLVDLIDAVPTLGPIFAGWLAETVDGMDRRVRKQLAMPDDRKLVPTLPCPACDNAGALALRMSGPVGLRAVVCTLRCVCTGPGCGCGMTVQAAGVEHVWTEAEMTAVLARMDRGLAA